MCWIDQLADQMDQGLMLRPTVTHDDCDGFFASDVLELSRATFLFLDFLSLFEMFLQRR
jgi:hypothetical protein